MNKMRILQVNDILEQSFFTAAGYAVEAPDSGELVVRIRLKDYETCVIVLDEVIRGGRKQLQVLEKPSDMREIEQANIASFEDFLVRLKSWTKRIEHFVRNGLTEEEVNLEDPLSKFRDEFNAKIEELIQDPDERFSQEERKDLEQRLQKLEEIVIELSTKQQATEEEIAKLKKFIQEMRQAAGVMTKRAWYRTFGNKLLSLGIRVLTSDEGLRVVESSLKQLMGGP